jgi:hypothetical protein
MSPFCVAYGWNPQLCTESRDEIPGGRAPAAIDAAERLRDVHETLVERWQKAGASQSKYYDKRHTPKTFKVGDIVLLLTKNLKLNVPKKKLGPKFVGPFKILDAVGAQAYRLALPTEKKIHNVFHVSLLKPYKGRVGEEYKGRLPLSDEDSEWEVEKVLDHRTRKKVRQYLIRWKG